MQGTFLVLLFIAASAVSAAAADESSVEYGRELFESAKLGTTGKSCATCHQGGRNLEWAATYDDGKLIGIINACIQKPLKGKPLSADSREMQSLLLYLKTFAGPGR